MPKGFITTKHSTKLPKDAVEVDFNSDGNWLADMATQRTLDATRAKRRSRMREQHAQHMRRLAWLAALDRRQGA
jgi:hypothetical protein